MKKLIGSLRQPVIAAGVFVLAITSGAANANFGDCKFYAGAGADYNTYKISKDVKKDFSIFKTDGLGLFAPIIGIKFHENFGLEAGYSFNKKFRFEDTKPITTFMPFGAIPAGVIAKWSETANAKVKNACLDLMGFLPIKDGQLEFFGGVGLGRLMVKADHVNIVVTGGGATVSGSVPINIKNKTSWRVKVGAMYNITNNFGIRVLAVYQNVGSKIHCGRGNIAEHAIVPSSESGKFVKNMKSIGLAAIYKF